MNTGRNVSYRTRWKELVEYYGIRCFYCRVEIATTIDHVIPYSYDQDNDIDNLVPACGLCNSLAGNKTFDDAEHKRQYILSQRDKRKLRRTLCTNCMIPYSYRLHSPSLFLCAECYDKEYGTSNSQLKEWSRWILELHEAGITIEAHRNLLVTLSKKKGKPWSRAKKSQLLAEEYIKILDSDIEFLDKLSN